MEFTRLDGVELALQMLREIEGVVDRQAGCYFLRADRRGRGDVQENVALRYLTALQSKNDAGLTEGFAAVLTEFCGMNCEGGYPDIERCYGDITESDFGVGTMTEDED